MYHCFSKFGSLISLVKIKDNLTISAYLATLQRYVWKRNGLMLVIQQFGNGI